MAQGSYLTVVVVLGMWRLVPETRRGGYGRPAATRNSPRSRCSGWLRRWLLLGVWGQQKSTSQRISRGGHSGETPGVAGGAGVRAGSGKVAWRGRIQPLLSQKSCKKFLGTVKVWLLQRSTSPVDTAVTVGPFLADGWALDPPQSLRCSHTRRRPRKSLGALENSC